MRRQRDDYWLEAGELPLNHLAQEVFRRVLRTDFRQPGFAILAFPQSLSSRALRETMVALKGELSRLFFDQWGERLEYLSMGRFNQQTTTKLHLDGAPVKNCFAPASPL